MEVTITDDAAAAYLRRFRPGAERAAALEQTLLFGVRAIVEDSNDGSYALRWRGEVCGAVLLHVTLDERPLVGSPLSLVESDRFSSDLDMGLLPLHCRQWKGGGQPGPPASLIAESA